MSSKRGRPAAPTETAAPDPTTATIVSVTPTPARPRTDQAPHRERRPPDPREPVTPPRKRRADRIIELPERSMDILRRRRCWLTADEDTP